MVPVYKGKGNVLHCTAYRGIELLEHGLQIYERILDKVFRQQVDRDEMQFGFMPGKGTVDAIFIPRQRQVKILEENGNKYTAFVDLEKAYDWVPRGVLYWSLRKRRVTSESCKKSV